MRDLTMREIIEKVDSNIEFFSEYSACRFDGYTVRMYFDALKEQILAGKKDESRRN